jgi:hypothetical protein
MTVAGRAIGDRAAACSTPSASSRETCGTVSDRRGHAKDPPPDVRDAGKRAGPRLTAPSTASRPANDSTSLLEHATIAALARALDPGDASPDPLATVPARAKQQIAAVARLRNKKRRR